MLRFKILWIIGVFILIPGLCLAQFSREQAKNLVLNQLLAGTLDHVIVYLANDPKSGQNGLMLGDATSISYPFNSNWVFFIDDNPFAGWAHSCRYAFISAETGEVNLITKDFFPSGLKISFTLISSIPFIESIPLNPDPNNVLAPVQTNPHLHAVFICGQDYSVFWNDVSAVYSTLVNYYGYSKENILVLYANGPNTCEQGDDLDGDGIFDDIDFDAHKSTIQNTFSSLQTTLGPQDELFVFVDDHGNTTLNGNSYIYLPGSNEFLFDYELASYVANINCSQMIYLFAQCYSGGFINDLMNLTNVSCKNRYVFTAANDNEESYFEQWMTGDHYGGKYFEFVYYWNAAIRGFYPATDEPWANSTFAVGSFPFSTKFQPPAKIHPPDWNPDSNTSKGGNNDGIIQMREAFNYADSMDTYSPNGYHCLCDNCGTVDEHPQTSESVSNGNGNGGFRDNVVGLTGLIGHMNTSQNVDGNRNYLIGGSLTVGNSNALNLEFGLNSKVYLQNNSKIYIEGGSSLNIHDGVEIYGNGQNSVRIENGTINLGQNVLFSSRNADQVFDGLYLSSYATPTQINHATFHRAHLWNESPSLSLSYTNFDHVATSEEDTYGVYSTAGNVAITQSTFTAASVNLINPDPIHHSNWQAFVQHCEFHYGGIRIEGYYYFSINFNLIESPYENAILAQYAGNGSSGNHTISNNHIYNSSIGVFLSNTYASITYNNIHDNQRGIYIGNSSHVSSLSGTTSLTQKIKDCAYEEMYIQKGCFPVIFKYNQIIDENNAGGNADPLIRYINYPVDPVIFDVTKNCWGRNFDPTLDLIGNQVTFNYIPTWCPGDPIPTDPPIDLYAKAINQYDSGNYANAKSIFKTIIDQFPKSVQAQAAMKELIQIEELADNDYLSLQQYYLTKDSIVADSTLSLSGEYLANRCNEKIENWPDEIAWFENKIMNPESEADSIFAILDLSHVYLLMENSPTKAAYIGALQQYKPKSLRQFIPYRDSLISLLPGDSKYKQLLKRISNLNDGELLQNNPNPVVENTDIFYKVNSSGDILITITDIFYRCVKTIHENNISTGTHKLSVNLSDLNPGLYFYTLTVNGKISDVKKLTVL
ncbi:MAG: T9SS type A sorting domain-containing protein [Bacteroidales bacterium]|jgi:hypothetical protein|nr:T9SS type A sorting domain-containing protein [Bacteroidales bacterium]